MDPTPNPLSPDTSQPIAQPPPGQPGESLTASQGLGSNRQPSGLRMDLTTRLAVNYAILAVLLAAISSIAFFFIARQQLRESLYQRMRDIVAAAVLQVDVDAHLSLAADPAQMSTPAYQQIFDTLNRIHRAIPELTYVYTERKIGDTVFFIVDGSIEEPSALGDAYPDAPPTLHRIIDTLEAPYVDPQIYTDSFGTWITAYAPLISSTGQRDGVLAIDMDVVKLQAAERQLFLTGTLIFLLTLPLAAVTGWLIGRRLSAPIATLTQATTRITQGEYQIQLPSRPAPRPGSLAAMIPAVTRLDIAAADELYILSENFNRMAVSIYEFVSQLEAQVEARTSQLARRTAYLEASSQVARSAASILDANLLSTDLVELIRQRFDLYYVGLFLVDDAREWAVLKAGTGAAGQAMLARGHRIRIGYGMIGWAVANAAPRIAEIAEEDRQRIITSELPDTHAEAAIPLRSRNQVIGALTVQSTQPNAFDETILFVLQTMADQVALALDNARLLAESQQNLQALQRSFSETSQQAWSSLLEQRRHTRQTTGYHYDRAGLTLLTSNPSQPAAVSDETLAADDPDATTITLPITVRGQVIGHVQARKQPAQQSNNGADAGEHPSGPTLAWRKAEIDLLQNLLTQMDATLDSARLFQETRRRGERERLAGEITGRLRASNNPQKILETAVTELRQALQAQQAQVTIQVTPQQPTTMAADQDPPPPDPGSKSNASSMPDVPSEQGA